MKHLIYSFTTMLIFSILPIKAQSVSKITGSIQDTMGSPLQNAHIYLFTSQDTVLVSETKSDKNGYFSLTNNTKLSVFVLAELSGYAPISTKVESGNLQIKLHKERTNDLGEAVISVTQKSTLKHETGKFVFTPKGIDLEQPNAYSMLNHVPLLSVNNEGISILGKGNSTIYINGRKPIEKGDALMEKIRGYQPTQIAKIEIMTNPGASQKASTQGGIVNIIIKRNDAGWAGSSYTEVSYQSRPSERENLSLRYGKDKFNASINLNASNGQGHYKGYDNTSYLALGKEVQNYYNKHSRSNNMGGSVDLSYNFNSSHIVGISANFGLYYNKTNYKISTTTTLNGVLQPLSCTDRNNRTPLNYKNPNYGILGYYTFITDKKGSFFNIDIDHSSYAINSTNNTSFSTMNNNVFISYSVYQEQKNRDAKSTNAKATYKWVINDDHNIQSGYELNASTLSVGFKRVNEINASDAFVPTYDDKFSYKENVQSLFANYHSDWSDIISSEIGLRAEYAYRNGILNTTNTNFKHHEWDWFPSASIDFDFVEDKHSLSLEYSRTIRRPFLSSLNPFVFWNSENTYSVGNPNLKPDFTNNFDVYYELFNDYIFDFNVLFNKDGYTEYSYQDGQGHTVYTCENQDKFISYSLSAEVNKTLFDGLWRLKCNISGSYNKNVAGHKNVDGTTFDNSYFDGDFTFNSTLRLSKRKRWTTDVYFYASTRDKIVGKNIPAEYHLSLALNKTFKFGGLLQFSVFSLLGSNLHDKWSYKTNTYATNSRDIINKRQFTVSFSIPFGKSNVRGARQKDSNKLSSKVQD